MGRRDSSKRKAPISEANYKTSSATDLTSQELLYTAKKRDARRYFEQSPNRKHYDDSYTSNKYNNYFEKYNQDRRSDDSALCNDFIMPTVSYNEPKNRQRHFRSPESRSDEVYNRRRSPHSYEYRSKSPPRDFNNFQREFLKKNKRSKYTKSPEQSKYYGYENDKKYDSKTYRKSRAPNTKKDYNDLIHEEPEKENDYEKYFEKTTPKDLSKPKYVKRDRNNDQENKAKLGSHPHKPEKDYHVYAYQEPRQTEGVFKTKRTEPVAQEQSLLSEFEVKSQEYPMLAFTDQKVGDNGSGTVYLPVVVVSNKSRKSKTEGDQRDKIIDTNKGHFQVFAANLRDQKNIFQNFGDAFELDTKKEKPQQACHTMDISSGLQYADSLVQSLVDKALTKSLPTPDLESDNRLTQRVPFKLNTTPFTYQVDVDILPDDKKMSVESKGPNAASIPDGTSYKKTMDPLHDDFPVTKDYITVKYSEQVRKSTLATQKSAEDTKSGTVTKQPSIPSRVIDKTRISHNFNDSNDNVPRRSIIRAPTQEYNQVNLEPPAKTDNNYNYKIKSPALGSRKSSVAIPNRMELAKEMDVKATPAVTRLGSVKEETVKRLTKTSCKEASGERSEAASSGIAVLVTGGKQSLAESRRKTIKPGTYNEQSGYIRNTITAGSVVVPAPDTKFSSQQETVKLSVHRESGNKRSLDVARKVLEQEAPGTQQLRSTRYDTHKELNEYERRKGSMATATVRGSKQPALSEAVTVKRQHTSTQKPQSTNRSRLEESLMSAVMVPNSKLLSQEKTSLKREQKLIEEPSLDRKSRTQSSTAPPGPRKTSKAPTRVSLASKKLSKTSTCQRQISNGNATNQGRAFGQHESKEDLKEFAKNFFSVDIDKLESQEKAFAQMSGDRTFADKSTTHNVPKNSVVNRVSDPKEDKGTTQSQKPYSKNGQPQANTAEFPNKPTVENQESSDCANTIKKQTSLHSLTRAFSRLRRKKSKSQDRHQHRSEADNQQDENSQFIESYEPTSSQCKKEKERTRSKGKSVTKTPSKEKKQKTLSKTFSRSKINSRVSESGDEQSQKKIKPKKSRSLLSGILRRNKSEDGKSKENLEDMNTDHQYAQNNNPTEVAGPCEYEHVATYITGARRCAHFFLGTTLHEEIMHILKMLF